VSNSTKGNRGKILGGREFRYLDKSKSSRELAGTYAVTPTFSPKYHTGHGPDSVLKQARFMIPLPSKLVLDRVIKTASGSAIARKILKVLTTRANDPTGATANSGLENKEGSWGGYGYVDFWLSQINLQFREKRQLVELTSDAYAVYYHGLAAPNISLSGSLLNTVQNNWWSNFLDLYISAIRGTKTAIFSAPLILLLDSKRYSISIDSLTQSLSADMEMLGSFSMQGLVSKIEEVDTFTSGDPTALENLAGVRTALDANTRPSLVINPSASPLVTNQGKASVANPCDLQSAFNVSALVCGERFALQMDSPPAADVSLDVETAVTIAQESYVLEEAASFVADPVAVNASFSEALFSGVE